MDAVQARVDAFRLNLIEAINDERVHEKYMFGGTASGYWVLPRKASWLEACRIKEIRFV